MKIHEIIRTRRQALGLTQEALAEKVGVSAPAVNKWEKALNYPDITLLPILARTLGVDMNTLLSFQQDMTREDIGLFLNELPAAAQANGCDAAFALAQDKLRQFPNNDLLACGIASVLESLLTLYAKDNQTEKETHQQQINALYERAMHSSDTQIREWAAYMAAVRCIGKGDLAQAEALLEQLPDTYKDKKMLAASLRKKQGQAQQAWVLLEQELFERANGIQIVLLHMTNLALAEGNADAAKLFADTAETVKNALHFSAFSISSASLQLAMAEQDGARTLSLLEKLLGGMTRPWALNASPLYRHLPAQGSTSKVGKTLRQSLLNQMQTDPEMQFLRDTAGYEKLIEKYKS